MHNMEIYLTRSCEAAHMLNNSTTRDFKGAVGVSSGCVERDARIPAIYHGDKWFYCIFEIEEELPSYKLTIL